MTEQDRVPAPTPDSEDSDIASLSYEEARDELVRVVSQLEQGSPTLEQSLQLWERGTALANRCEQWLTGARERLAAAQPTAAAPSSDGPADD